MLLLANLCISRTACVYKFTSCARNQSLGFGYYVIMMAFRVTCNGLVGAFVSNQSVWFSPNLQICHLRAIQGQEDACCSIRHFGHAFECAEQFVQLLILHSMFLIVSGGLVNFPPGLCFRVDKSSLNSDIKISGM